MVVDIFGFRSPFRNTKGPCLFVLLTQAKMKFSCRTFSCLVIAVYRLIRSFCMHPICQTNWLNLLHVRQSKQLSYKLIWATDRTSRCPQASMSFFVCSNVCYCVPKWSCLGVQKFPRHNTCVLCIHSRLCGLVSLCVMTRHFIFFFQLYSIIKGRKETMILLEKLAFTR